MPLQRTVPELIEFLNSTLGNDMVYLLACMVTEDTRYSRNGISNFCLLDKLVDLPMSYPHSEFISSSLVASGLRL